ncbi:MAG TPA: hypothetical protein VIV60_26005 [Polyangiaceae bacterium]
MTRKTWPLLLGSFVVSTVLIAACNSSSDDEEDAQPNKGGSSAASTAKGGATQTTGVLPRGGTNSTQAATGRGGSNIFNSITPASGSTTARGGASNRGGAATNAGNGNRAGNAGAVAQAGSSNVNRGGSAGAGGGGATAGIVGKGGGAGAPSDGGTSAIAGHAGTSNESTNVASAGSTGTSNPPTGGASTGGTSSSIAGSAGAAGGPALLKTCTDGCAHVEIPFSAAGQTAQFVATFAATNLASTSVASITVYAPNATTGDQIQLKIDNGNQKCSPLAQGLSTAASGYTTINFSLSSCLFNTNVIHAWVIVTSGGNTEQALSIETISISNTTPDLTLPLNASGLVQVGADDCGEGLFCAVTGTTAGTVTGLLSWTPPEG